MIVRRPIAVLLLPMLLTIEKFQRINSITLRGTKSTRIEDSSASLNEDLLNSGTSTSSIDEPSPKHKKSSPRTLQEDIQSGCYAPIKRFIGDGWCDQDERYNNAACGYDGGDCCPETCDDSTEYGCVYPFDCKDPGDAEIKEDEPFTIIFISDLENKYRGHSIGRSHYVVSQIKDLEKKEIYFEGDYSGFKVDPKLVIHGGDISHLWSCKNFWGCRDPDAEFRDIWNQLYDSGIPMISAFGNHDWDSAIDTGNYDKWRGDDARTEETNLINRQSNEFVRKSFSKSKDVTNGALTYIEFPPEGDIGQSMYKASFRGLQIGHFGCSSDWESYDVNDADIHTAKSQRESLDQSLDRDVPTLFFSHYPVKSQPVLKDIIWQFPIATFFSGHVHIASEHHYADESRTFTDYTAPYPHEWEGRAPGFYAVLASATKGVIQVKTIQLEGWENGALCGIGTTCDYCSAGYETYWYGKAMTACGKEPCWGDGTFCGPCTTCNQCCRYSWGFSCGY